MNRRSSSRDSRSSSYTNSAANGNTVTQRLIRSITPKLLKKMKSYIQKNKSLFQLKHKHTHRITLYEDMFMLASLKQAQQWIFESKRQLQQRIDYIAKQLGRQPISIYDRVRKKLSQLDQRQFIYLMENHKSLTFRGNTHFVNMDDWPRHLRYNSYGENMNDISQDDNVINLQSSSEQQSIQSNRGGRGRRQQTVERRRQQIIGRIENNVDQLRRRLENWRNNGNNQQHNNEEQDDEEQDDRIMQKVQHIMNQPQGQSSNRSQRHQNTNTIKYNKNNKNQTPLSTQKLYNLSDPQQKQTFLDITIQKWKTKHLTQEYYESRRVQYESKICYNFRTRQYMYINPQVIRNVWNNLHQQCMINEIKRKNNQKMKMDWERRENKSREEKKNVRNVIEERNYQFQQQVEVNIDIDDDGEMRQDKIMKSTTNINSKKYQYQQKHQQHQQEQQWQWSSSNNSKLKNTPLNNNNLNSNNHNIANNTQQQSISQLSSQQPQQQMIRIKNPIRMIEQIASMYNQHTASAEVKQLIKKGLAIKQRLTKQLHKYHNDQQQEEEKDDVEKEKANAIREKQMKEKQMHNQIWYGDDDDYDKIQDQNKHQLHMQNNQLYQAQKQQQKIQQSHSKPKNYNNQIDKLLEENSFQFHKNQQPQQGNQKSMIYWFNNDQQLYQVYKDNPYQMGYLLWTQEQDQLINNANQNMSQYIDHFKALIEDKTPQYLIKRIKFLQIYPSTQLYLIVNKYLQEDDL